MIVETGSAPGVGAVRKGLPEGAGRIDESFGFLLAVAEITEAEDLPAATGLAPMDSDTAAPAAVGPADVPRTDMQLAVALFGPAAPPLAAPVSPPPSETWPVAPAAASAAPSAATAGDGRSLAAAPAAPRAAAYDLAGGPPREAAPQAMPAPAAGEGRPVKGPDTATAAWPASPAGLEPARGPDGRSAIGQDVPVEAPAVGSPATRGAPDPSPAAAQATTPPLAAPARDDAPPPAAPRAAAAAEDAAVREGGGVTAGQPAPAADILPAKDARTGSGRPGGARDAAAPAMPDAALRDVPPPRASTPGRTSLPAPRPDEVRSARPGPDIGETIEAEPAPVAGDSPETRARPEAAGAATPTAAGLAPAAPAGAVPPAEAPAQLPVPADGDSAGPAGEIAADGPAGVPREGRPATEAAAGGEAPSGLPEKVAQTSDPQPVVRLADPAAPLDPLPEPLTGPAGEPAGRTSEAPASAGATSSSSDPARSVAAQLAAAVTADREGGYEVRLSPEELGTVKMTLHVGDGTVTVAIQAERPETLDLMRRNIDILEREFRDAGFSSLNLSFGHGGGERQAPVATAYAEMAQDRPPAPQAAAQGEPVRARAPSKSLDLRL